MRIATVDIFPITLNLDNPIAMSSGVVGRTENVIVRVRSDDGLTGWGEGVEAPALTGHRQANIVADLEALTPLVVGADPTRRSELWLRMREQAPTATTAIGAVDVAVHDLAARALGIPVHQLIGGQVRDLIPALWLVGSGQPDADVERIERLHESGARWFKVKLGLASHEVELTTMRRAVDAAGVGGVIAGDANGAWTESEAGDFLDSLTGSGVRFVEQPVPAAETEALLRLARRSDVALCADESAASLEDVAGFAGSALGGVSLKLIKHGGITGVMRGAAICSAAGLQVNLAGKVAESSISSAALLHCAAAVDGFAFGCSPANRGLARDVAESPITFQGGEYQVPTGPGLGVDVSKDLLQALAT